jgi:hypothetical protein
MDAAGLERILRVQNPTIERERAAEASGRWKEYLRERVRPPPWWAFGRRRAWQAAYERALALGNAREVRQALIVELWYGENQDEVASSEWSRRIFVSFGDRDYDQIDKAQLGNRVIRASVERARRSMILPSRYYAPSVVLPYRNRHFVTVEGRSTERVVAVEQVIDAPAAPKPTREIPAFSTDAECAVTLDALDAECGRTISGLVDSLRIFPELDG